MALAQSLVVSGTDGLTFTNDPTAVDFVIPEGGLAFPDFDFRLAYGPDSDDFPGAILTGRAQGLGSLPFQVNVQGATLADLQTNRRAVEAAFSQVGETVTIGFGDQTEVYPFMPAWPKWGVVDSGRLARRIFTATLAIPVNPMVVA